MLVRDRKHAVHSMSHRRKRRGNLLSLFSGEVRNPQPSNTFLV